MVKTTVCLLAVLLCVRTALAQPADDAAQRRAEQALPRTAITIDPASFDKYAGFYHMPSTLRPNTVITVSRDGDHFFVKLSRGQAREVFPERPGKFFFMGLPAQISFTADAGGDVTGLVVHQGGLEVPAPRITQAQAQAIEAAPLPKIGHPMARTWPMTAGIAPRPLTSGAGSIDYWPCFSPDGKTVLFSRSLDGGKSWALFHVPTAGGDAVALAGTPLPVSATRADWSAKNGLIAFTATADQSNSVWLAKADGSGAHAVTGGTSNQLFYPSWYPDGKNLAVMDGVNSVIGRLDTESGTVVAVTDRTQVLTGMPSVSPDGRWIAFAGQKNAGQPYNQEENVIWLLDEDGALHTLEAGAAPGRAPAWSPDAKHLAFESDRGSPDGHYAVFVINRDGTGLEQVTDYALNATHPVWSPDGRKMVFAVQTAAGTAAIAITDFPGVP